jgi:carbamoyltransferase
MTILGISALYHDSAAVILRDGEILAAAQEERFSRIKHDASFPSASLRWCLQYAGCGLRGIDAIAFYDKPFLKFERLLETYYSYAPRGLFSFLRAMPVWIKEKLFLKRFLYSELFKIQHFDKRKLPLLFPEHHLSHAASAYYASPFETAAILTLDGVGEWATASICKGEGKDISVLKELDFPHSLGLLYSAFTYYCGFAVNDGEYKLMGLAPYGDKASEEYRRIADIIRFKLTELCDDGSIFLHQEFFSYATGRRMVRDRVWKTLFGFPRRQPGAPLDPCYCNMALAIQALLEEAILRMAKEAKRLTGCGSVCLAGGVALNGVANGKLQEAGIFQDLFIQPAAGDAGGALGAAYAAYHIYFGKQRKPFSGDAMKGSYLGPEYGESDVIKVADRYGISYLKMESLESLAKATADMINDGKVVGWFQGRMEFGPRALGARSILADPRNPGMQKKLNLSIKFREGFRPFAPAVLAEDVKEYFDTRNGDGGSSGEPFISPYMLIVKSINPSRRIKLPEGYAFWSLQDKLAFVRSDLPAITHVDYSARIQTVHRQTNPRFWHLLRTFRELTGCGVLINTSFNVRDEPIVNSPEDAFKCWLSTDMDCLVIGDLIFEKANQPIELLYRKPYLAGDSAATG